jgi:hypothetical protein
MAIDFAQFFNPNAWGAWAPGQQGVLNPQVATNPNAPQPSGGIVSPGAPPAQVIGANAPGAPPVPAAAPLAGGAGALAAPSNPAGGGTGGQGWNGLLQKAALMVNPPPAAPQPLQMAKPVGPGQFATGGAGAPNPLAVSLSPGMLNQNTWM